MTEKMSPHLESAERDPKRLVLLVENSETLRDILFDLYTSEGVAVIMVKKPEDAQEVIEAGVPVTEIVADDGLGPDCLDLRPIAQEGIPVCLLASDSLYTREASKAGYHILDKATLTPEQLLANPEERTDNTNIW